MKKATLRISRSILTAAAMICASTVSAQVVRGAGATLPWPLYNDIFSSNGLDGVVGTWDYEGGGSAEGKKRFLDKFRSDIVSFAGSDSVLRAAELADYNLRNHSTWGPLIQLPAFITPIVLAYTKSGLSELSLTRSQVCGIFAGRPSAQTWGQVLGNGDPQPIRVVYRSGSSGSTEILSKFLFEACSGYGFVITDSFETMVGGAMMNGIPNHWLAVTSDGDMSTSARVNGSLGYLGPAYGFTPNDPTKVAKIDGFLPSNINVVSTVLPPVGAAKSDPMNWIPSFMVPSTGTGYPIYGSTNLLVAQCYEGGFGIGSVGAAVRAFLLKLYGTTAYAQKISSNYFVELPGIWKTAIRDTFLVSQPNNALDIGNPLVCSNVGHP